MFRSWWKEKGTATKSIGDNPYSRSTRLLRAKLALALALLCAAQGVLAEKVTLNFKDADISAVIGTVAEITGKNFIVDPRVKGKVTVVSSHPMNRDEVYQVFLSILQVHGFATVPAGEVIKIIPDATAKQDATQVVDDGKGEGDEVVTRVLQVRNVAAAQLVPILRPLIPQQGHLAAYPATNVLIISDRAANIGRLVKIIRDIDQASDTEVDVIPLRNASASEVARILTALEQKQAKGAEAVTEGVQLTADDRTNSIIVSGGRAARVRLRALIAQLDTPIEVTGNTQVVYLRYARAKDLVPVLKGVGAMAEADRKGGGQAGQAAPAAAAGAAFDIQADEATNALVITAPPDQMRTLKAVISQLDIRRAQVLVEGIIVEMSDEKAREFGVQWAVDGTPNGNGPVAVTNLASPGLIEILSSVQAGSPVVLNGLSLAVGQFASDTLNFGALVRALSGDATNNVLSTPSLLTLDNQEAEIVVGQNVPFITGQFTSGTGAGVSPVTGTVTPFQTIQRQDVGLTLKVKPQINEGNAVKLDIQQEVSSLQAGAIAASDIITNKRSIKTSVLVESNQLVVLGGLIDDNQRQNVQKVPGLGDLPLLGALFRYQTSNKTKRNLMVFLHPVIVRDEETLGAYSKSKYSYIRAEQLQRAQRGVPLMSGEQTPVLPQYKDLLALPPPFEETNAKPEGQQLP